MTWLEQYQRGLLGAFLPKPAAHRSPRAVQEIISQSRAITAHLPSPSDRPRWALLGNLVSGAVIGAIQSGKTASMIGVGAAAMDAGFQLVVVLAGLKNDLRSQTARRFVTDLLQRGEPVEGVPTQFTHPRGPGSHGLIPAERCWCPPYSQDVVSLGSIVGPLRRAFQQGRSVLLIVKKNGSNLGRLAPQIAAAEAAAGGPVTKLVLDDECDEATAPSYPAAPTPREIASLWRSEASDRPAAPTAYIGYTATPQASFLQADTNPLFPASFVEILRTPSSDESALTYALDRLDDWYTGGDLYYSYLARQDRRNHLVSPSILPQEEAGQLADWRCSELAEALVDFFVSGAIRLSLVPGSDPGDPAHLPRPHCMLVHTDGGQDQHLKLAERIQSICNHPDRPSDEASFFDTPPAHRISPARLAAWLESEPERWRRSYLRFSESRETWRALLPGCRPATWPSLEQTLSSLPRVFAVTKLKVVNAAAGNNDPVVDFEPRTLPTGEATLPEDLFTIVVGGNVLSRGLTLPGLCITYFTRAEPRGDDTRLQRQRWFGYRGSHIEFCRLYTTPAIHTGLQDAHERDRGLREQVADACARGLSPKDARFSFLRSIGGLPSNKLGSGTRVAFCYTGSKPFIRQLHLGSMDPGVPLAKENCGVAQDLVGALVSRSTPRVSRDGSVLGLLGSERQGALWVADQLCRIGYGPHNPGTRGGVYSLLSQVELTLGTPANSIVRPRDPRYPEGSCLDTMADPFLVAGYLRFWHLAYQVTQRDARARFQGPDGLPWNPTPPPEFAFGVRFGTGQRADSACRTMKRHCTASGLLTGGWGARNIAGGYYGDEWFDCDPEAGEHLMPRPTGALGLLLLQLIDRAAGDSIPDAWDRPTFGVVIPDGGPAIFGVVK